MELTTANRQIDDVTVVDIKGRIVVGEESAALRSLVADLLSEGRKKILFNLAEVRYIDSTGLGALVSAYTSVRKHNADLKLLNLSAKVQDVMQLTKLYTIFDVSNDEAAALKSFDRAAAATQASQLN
jgi:anti-sigma B factor antagonist